MLFLVAAVAISISAGGWWMQRIVFTPDSTRDTSEAILKDPDIRLEINSLVAAASSPIVERDVPELGAWLEIQVLSTRGGAAVMAPIMEEAHNRILGLREEPVRITGTQMIDIVRDQRAAEVSPITLPIEPIGTLKTMRQLLGWLIPIAGGLGLLLVVLGIFTRPDRRDVLRGLGEFGLALAASILVFGYVLPVHMMTAIDNRTWTNAIPRLALRTLPVVLGLAVIFAVGGVVLILTSTSGGNRRQWSTPLSATRYRGGSNPGWG